MEYSTLNDILPLVNATGKKIVPFQKSKRERLVKAAGLSLFSVTLS